MKAQVSLQDIVFGTECQSDELRSFLNVATGTVLAVTDEQISAVENGTGADSYSPEELQDARDVLAEKDCIPLPSQFDIHEYQMMVRFADSVDNESHSDELHNALRGRGAFRCFKDTTYRLGIEKNWYTFRDKAYEELAVEWCEENGIKYHRGETP